MTRAMQFFLGIVSDRHVRAAMQGDKERALGCGCQDYLSKPIDEDLLFEKINRLLSC